MYGHGEMVDLLLSHGGNSMEFSVCIFWLMQHTCDFLGIVSKFRFWYKMSLSESINCYPPRYHQKTFGFLMILGEIGVS